MGVTLDVVPGEFVVQSRLREQARLASTDKARRYVSVQQVEQIFQRFLQQLRKDAFELWVSFSAKHRAAQRRAAATVVVQASRAYLARCELARLRAQAREREARTIRALTAARIRHQLEVAARRMAASRVLFR